MTAQYYTANGFVTNVDDVCTSGATVTLSNYSGNLLAGQTTPSFTQPPAAGNFNLVLSLPGVGRDGGADLTATVPSYLRFDWSTDGNQDGNYDDNPSARATFGIFKGTKEQIYMREIVR